MKFKIIKSVLCFEWADNGTNYPNGIRKLMWPQLKYFKMQRCFICDGFPCIWIWNSWNVTFSPSFSLSLSVLVISVLECSVLVCSMQYRSLFLYNGKTVQRIPANVLDNPSLNILKISFLDDNLFKSFQLVHFQTDTITMNVRTTSCSFMDFNGNFSSPGAY